MIGEINKILSGGQNLTGQQMQAAMEEIMSGKLETAEIVSFLTELNKKGQTVEELSAAARVLRKFATRINSKQKIVLDTCGTGGDKKGTFNISTTVAFVVAGSGIAVAKHGNRAVSSCCGSADILEALGININLSKESLEKCLDEAGIAFLFAPNLHPAMKYAMPARKQIGKRTIFNILGPLSNPAGAAHQLVGVFEKDLTSTLAGVLNSLGSKHALVVFGKDGLDEITTTDTTFVSEVKDGRIKNYEISPEDFGLKRATLKELAGGTAQENANMLLDVLKGEGGAKQVIVLFNAGAAIYAADKSDSIKEGIALAKKSIDSGKALEKLELLREYSHT